jgi:hypothetical protein
MQWLDGAGIGICAHLLQGWDSMPRILPLLAISAITAGCIGTRDDAKQPVPSAFTTATDPIATVTVVGADTLGDSARIHHLAPEPDGKSIAFLFADPANGITQGLGIVQASGGQLPQLGWPDSVTSVWWSGPHQLSFTAGTGRGVRLVVDAHAAQLEAMAVTGTHNPPGPGTSVPKPNTNALLRAQAFIDSVRVQPEGMPQGSALRYRADSIIVAPGNTLAAVHVSASDIQGTKVNPTWYLVHLPSGHVRAVDSLIGRSSGLSASAGQWGADGAFYYAKERSLWRVRPSVQ